MRYVDPRAAYHRPMHSFAEQPALGIDGIPMLPDVELAVLGERNPVGEGEGPARAVVGDIPPPLVRRPEVRLLAGLLLLCVGRCRECVVGWKAKDDENFLIGDVGLRRPVLRAIEESRWSVLAELSLVGPVAHDEGARRTDLSAIHFYSDEARSSAGPHQHLEKGRFSLDYQRLHAADGHHIRVAISGKPLSLNRYQRARPTCLRRESNYPERTWARKQLSDPGY